MTTPIVVLSPGAPASLATVAYTTLLASTMAVPMCLLEMPLVAASECELTASLPVTSTSLLRPSRTVDIPGSLATEVEEIEAILERQDALLVVMPVPADPIPTGGWAAPAVWSLLQDIRVPLLLVPDRTNGQALPLHMALVTDGDPFTLLHGQRAMHALLLTLPIHITVLHVPVPRSTSSPPDALQTLLTCGLATRYLTTAAALAVQADSTKDGVLARVQQIQADLLVLIIRQASLKERGSRMNLITALLQQSTIPILLLLAA